MTCKQKKDHLQKPEHDMQWYILLLNNMLQKQSTDRCRTLQIPPSHRKNGGKTLLTLLFLFPIHVLRHLLQKIRFQCVTSPAHEVDVETDWNSVTGSDGDKRSTLCGRLGKVLVSDNTAQGKRSLPHPRSFVCLFVRFSCFSFSYFAFGSLALNVIYLTTKLPLGSPRMETCLLPT